MFSFELISTEIISTQDKTQMDILDIYKFELRIHKFQ